LAIWAGCWTGSTPSTSPWHGLAGETAASSRLTPAVTRRIAASPAAALTSGRNRTNVISGGPAQLAAAGPRSWADASAPVPIEVCSTSDSPTVGIVAVPTMVSGSWSRRPGPVRVNDTVPPTRWCSAASVAGPSTTWFLPETGPPDRIGGATVAFGSPNSTGTACPSRSAVA
jgi:hypothetical protein